MVAFFGELFDGGCAILDGSVSVVACFAEVLEVLCFSCDGFEAFAAHVSGSTVDSLCASCGEAVAFHGL